MDLESYLIEQKSQIIAISRISQIIEQSLSENYYKIIKGRIDKGGCEKIQNLTEF